MRHVLACCAAIALTSGLVAPVAAQDTARIGVAEGDLVNPALSMIEVGILCALGAVRTEPAPDTVAGVTNIIEGDPQMVSYTRRVPAVIGIGFGVRAQMSKRDYPATTMVVTHPPMGPDGVTRQTFPSSIESSAPHLTYYHLEYDYELVEGTWTLSAFEGDLPIYSVSFEVVAPQEVPELASICGYENLLSKRG